MNQKFKGGLFVFLGGCSFGVLSTIVKTAYKEGFTLGEITGIQTFFGAEMLWGLYLLTRNTKALSKSTSHVKSSKVKLLKVALAGCFTGLVGIFYYRCVNLLPASIAIILLMQNIWISILLELLFFKKKPHPMQLIAAAIVLIGTVFAAGLFNQSININAEGLIYGFLAACSYAAFLMTSGRVGNELPPLKKSALMITGSMILTWIIFPPTFLYNGLLLHSSFLQWGFLLALLGAVIPPLFFSLGVPKVGVSIGAILSAVELPVAVTFSHLILGEPVQALQWLGVLLILIAIILPNLKLDRFKMFSPQKL